MFIVVASIFNVQFSKCLLLLGFKITSLMSPSLNQMECEIRSREVHSRYIMSSAEHTHWQLVLSPYLLSTRIPIFIYLVFCTTHNENEWCVDSASKEPSILTTSIVKIATTSKAMNGLAKTVNWQMQCWTQKKSKPDVYHFWSSWRSKQPWYVPVPSHIQVGPIRTPPTVDCNIFFDKCNVEPSSSSSRPHPSWASSNSSTSKFGNPEKSPVSQKLCR